MRKRQEAELYPDLSEAIRAYVKKNGLKLDWPSYELQGVINVDDVERPFKVTVNELHHRAPSLDILVGPELGGSGVKDGAMGYHTIEHGDGESPESLLTGKLNEVEIRYCTEARHYMARSVTVFKSKISDLKRPQATYLQNFYTSARLEIYSALTGESFSSAKRAASATPSAG